MQRGTRIASASLLLVVTGFAPVALRSYPNGPPPAHTGGFGEPTCQICHAQSAVNAREGWLGVEGVPEVYEPGRTYRLTVSVGRAGLGASGFQMSARYATGPAPGSNAGELTSIDARTEVQRVDSTGVSYAHHREAGSVPLSKDSTGWSIEWTAPHRAGGAIAFDVAANAGDGDASEFGDWIYAERHITNPREDP